MSLLLHIFLDNSVIPKTLTCGDVLYRRASFSRKLIFKLNTPYFNRGVTRLIPAYNNLSRPHRTARPLFQTTGNRISQNSISSYQIALA